MGKALRDAWGACDAICNESMKQTNNEDVDQLFSMANHMEQDIGMDVTKVDIGA
jgi:hypothetical protein